jgi:hypothetical protein
MQNANQYSSNVASHRSMRDSLGSRARSGWETARREATTPRIAAAVAIGAAAAAYGLLRDPDRRERLRQSAHDLTEDLKSRMHFGTETSAAQRQQVPIT